MSDIVDFPPPAPPPEWIIGPFEEWRVIVDGRVIPKLTAYRQTDGRVTLIVDRRFSADFPNEGIARDAAALIANALAIGAGYAWSGSDTKERPFAPKGMEISTDA